MPQVSREALGTSSDIQDVVVKVVSQKGSCFARHKVGDRFLFGRDHLSPGGLCTEALPILLPHVRIVQRGGKHPESSELGVIRLSCPDPDNPVVFEVRKASS